MNGKPNSIPTATDLTPPHCAAIPGELYAVYIPRGNQARSFKLTNLRSGRYEAQWLNPRTGDTNYIAEPPAKQKEK